MTPSCNRKQSLQKNPWASSCGAVGIAACADYSDRAFLLLEQVVEAERDSEEEDEEHGVRVGDVKVHGARALEAAEGALVGHDRDAARRVLRRAALEPVRRALAPVVAAHALLVALLILAQGLPVGVSAGAYILVDVAAASRCRPP